MGLSTDFMIISKDKKETADRFINCSIIHVFSCLRQEAVFKIVFLKIIFSEIVFKYRCITPLWHRQLTD